MIGETNINGGAGLNGTGALLKIKSETGSIVTVSKGSYSKIIKTSQLDPDDGKQSYWFFQTADFGEWTVTATSGTDTVSDTVTIDSNKQYDVELSFNLYLLKNGKFQYEYTVIGNPTISEEADGSVQIKPRSDYQGLWILLTNEVLGGRSYSQFICEFSYSGDTSCKWGISTNTDLGNQWGDKVQWVVVESGNANNPNPYTSSFDVSNIDLAGKYFIMRLAYTSSRLNFLNAYFAR